MVALLWGGERNEHGNENLGKLAELKNVNITKLNIENATL